jgi:hypothetical protein
MTSYESTEDISMNLLPKNHSKSLLTKDYIITNPKGDRKACYNCDNALYPNGEIAPIENKTCFCENKEYEIWYVCDKWAEKK